MRYDCAIIGAGPAGLEAALHLQIRKKNFLLFGPGTLSRKVSVAPLVHNYLGLPSITGKELSEAFSSHLEQMEIAVTPEMASLIYPMGNFFSIATNHNIYEATTVILAPGVFSSHLLEGEASLLGRGVGYCATCDAPLYKGKTVAIVGYTEDSIQEANFVAEIAAKTYFLPGRKLEGTLTEGIETILAPVKGVLGDSRVSGLQLADRVLPVDGVFILRDSAPPDSLLPGLGLKDTFIEVDAAMRTNIPGCYAAGDCTGRPHQYIRAAGQGLTAAHSAVEYIDSHK